MATLLLDTHVVLWAMGSPELLGDGTRAAIGSADNDVVVSVASVWEASIKAALGRLRAPVALWDEVERAGVRIVTIERDDAIAAAALPMHHRDPFDRMLVAQARARRARLVTTDDALRSYDVDVLDATQ